MPRGKRNLDPKPSYWRIIQLLRKLRLKYRERNKGQNSYHILVEDFGIVLKFSNRMISTKYGGWDEVTVDLEEYEVNPLEFGQNFMWMLINKGYMSFLRRPENGHSPIFKHFIVNEGWGLKIIDKRIELYNDEPRHKYMITLNKELRKKSISYILTYYPSFFDYLW